MEQEKQFKKHYDCIECIFTYVLIVPNWWISWFLSNFWVNGAWIKYQVNVSCDRDSGRRPKLKKTAEQSCTILHDTTKTPKSEILSSCDRVNTKPIQSCFSILKDLNVYFTTPFRASKNSIWFGTYDIFKNAIFDLIIFPWSSSSSPSNA